MALSSTHALVDQFLHETAEAKERLGSILQRADHSVFTGSSGNGHVITEVNGFGWLRRLHITSEALQEHTAQALAELVLCSVAEARRQALNAHDARLYTAAALFDA
ncbi:YbaB/EbfC family nucleoid-associated protein (plasmid) [Streptomyces sp. AHU1]|uniref:YbaB/EbfC family nucleoid-associated protein n=1 Tax=Streptomyces sp. AHU1 TaxID=3377215 RepID=UPI003877CED5